MRILYVGNGNYNHNGSRYYDVGRKLVNGFIRNGHNVYFLSDRDTARAATIIKSRKLGVRHCNRAFLLTCFNYRPDLIILAHADIILPDVLKTVRWNFRSVRIAQVNVDPLFRPDNVIKLKSKLDDVDATFVTTAGPILRRLTHPRGLACHIPNPIDTSIECPRCHECSNQPNDVFWAQRGGKTTITGDPRFDIPLYLEQDSRVVIDYHGMNNNKELWGAKYYDAISKARMGLNISIAGEYAGGTPASKDELYLYSSDRLSQYMGSGLLTLMPRVNSLDELFIENKEAVFFSGKEDLLDKVLYYKHNDAERKTVASAGWIKAHTQFNERLVAKYIVERTFQLSLSEHYAWPTDVY